MNGTAGSNLGCSDPASLLSRSPWVNVIPSLFYFPFHCYHLGKFPSHCYEWIVLVPLSGCFHLQIMMNTFTEFIKMPLSLAHINVGTSLLFTELSMSSLRGHPVPHMWPAFWSHASLFSLRWPPKALWVLCPLPHVFSCLCLCAYDDLPPQTPLLLHMDPGILPRLWRDFLSFGLQIPSHLWWTILFSTGYENPSGV